MNPYRLLLPAALLGISISPSAAEDWARFRGPAGDGIVRSTVPFPHEWSESKNMVWRTKLPGPGSSSPVVIGERVYLTCYGGYGLDKTDPGDLGKLERHALCLDRATGKIVWTHLVKAPGPDRPYQGEYITTHGYASSTPVADAQAVFFFFGNAGVLAFALDGKPLWKASVGDGANDWGAGASPILHDDLVIVNAAIESDSLVALDRRNGRVAWSVKGFPRAWNTPAVLKSPEGREELVINTSGRLRAFDPKTGKELWFCQGIKAAELCPSPIAHDGVIYVIGGPRGEAFAVRAGGSGDVSDSHVLWRAQKGSNVSSPIYHDGHLYFVNDSRGMAMCLDAATGAVVFEERLSRSRDRWYASPILAGDRLFFTGRTSGTTVLAADPRFEVLGVNAIAGDDSIFNGSPAVADGSLFLRSNQYAYRIGTGRAAR